MKNKTLLLLLLCAVSVTALAEGVPSLQVDKTVSGTAFLLSKMDVDFSDLDVRDAQDRVVAAPSARQELEALFRENLINLTLFASPHTYSEALTWLDSFSHLFNELFFMRVSILFGLLQDVFMPPSRRFVHNVDNLCITFSVGVFGCCLLLSAFSLQRSPRHLHLRC